MFGRGAAAWRGSSASSNFRVWGLRTVSLEVLLAGSDELDGDELVAGGGGKRVSVECPCSVGSLNGLNGPNGHEEAYPRCSNRWMMGPTRPRWKRCQSWHRGERGPECANAHTWTPSGLIAMKLQVVYVSNLAEKRGGVTIEA